jgi:hypothetical protein
MDQRPLVFAGTVAVAVAGSVAGLLLIAKDPRATCVVHAPVPAAALQALAAYAGRIRHDSVRSTGGVLRQSWLDPSTGSERSLSYGPRGAVTAEFGVAPRGAKEEALWVLYPVRAWMAHVVRLRPATSTNLALDEAQSVRDRLARGKAALVGREVVAGRRTLHLRETEQFPARRLPKGFPLAIRLPLPPPFRVDTWVDALTFVPLQTSFESGSRHPQITKTTWLPRTPANLAKTKLVVPRGFKHVAQPGTTFSFSFQVSGSDGVAGCTQP